MPIANVQIMEGRSQEQKELLISKVTESIAEALDVPTQNVRVLIQELPKGNFGIGGVSAEKLGR